MTMFRVQHAWQTASAGLPRYPDRARLTDAMTTLRAASRELGRTRVECPSACHFQRQVEAVFAVTKQLAEFGVINLATARFVQNSQKIFDLLCG